MSLMGPGVSKEQADILQDIQNMLTAGPDAIGMPINIHIRGEANVRRDLYGSIKAWGPAALNFTIGAYPFIHNPSQRDLEKAGMREHVDLITYTAMKDWIDQGLDVEAFDPERITMTTTGDAGQVGRTWKLKDRKHSNEYGNQEAYIVIGWEHA